MNSTFKEELHRKGCITYTNIGTSMMPLLRQQKDLFVIEKKTEERCRKYDAVLFQRKNGQYVLHRILKVREKDYVLCGDHQYHREYGITEEQILGVMTMVIRDGTSISVTDLRYQCYVHLWCDLFYIRAMLLWIKTVPGRIRRKLTRMTTR